MKVGYQILADLQQQQAFKQWGASGYAVTFPIAFNVVYNVLSIPQTTASTSNAYWGRFYITALTKNGFNVSDTGAGSNRWIAIGSAQQQWGFKEHNNTHQSTVKLPIAFKKGGYVGAANDSGTVTIGIKPTDKQTIELRDNNGGGKTGIYWFVVGQ